MIYLNSLILLLQGRSILIFALQRLEESVFTLLDVYFLSMDIYCNPMYKFLGLYSCVSNEVAASVFIITHYYRRVQEV